MEATGVSLNSIVDSLKETNLNYPGGTTMGKTYEYLVRTMGEFKHIDEIGRTVVKVGRRTRGNATGTDPAGRKTSWAQRQRLVYLETMSETKDAFREQTSFSRHNGLANISIAIQKQADANTLNTAARVTAAIEEIKISLPKGMQIDLVYNEADFIRDAINGLVVDSILGGLLAFLVLYFFLRNVTSSVDGRAHHPRGGDVHLRFHVFRPCFHQFAFPGGNRACGGVPGRQRDRLHGKRDAP
jgi:HAE1 family hydrophobic/amphiphilic exporter-1